MFGFVVFRPNVAILQITFVDMKSILWYQKLILTTVVNTLGFTVLTIFINIPYRTKYTILLNFKSYSIFLPAAFFKKRKPEYHWSCVAHLSA